jgi:hypothetical protein
MYNTYILINQNLSRPYTLKTETGQALDSDSSG